MTAPAPGAVARRAVEAVWRIEGARIVGVLTRSTGDFALAEDAAQEALAQALAQWPAEGVPHNPGAWLTTVAKRRALDTWRRDAGLGERHAAIAELWGGHPDARERDLVADDVLRLMFVACHPVLGREAQVALTLRVVAGLTSEEIARLFLLPVGTVQQRIVRAKKTLAAARVPFESPEPGEWSDRLTSVLAVIYLVFSEGYAATSGERWMRPELAQEALRLGRVLAELLPREPEVHGLVALMELQASRFTARTAPDGSPVLLDAQDRRRWDRGQITRGRTALQRSDEIAARRGRGRGAYALQAAIAECHAVAASVAATDWERIVVLYEALGRLAPNPVVHLNRAVAVSMAVGPASALRLVDELAASGALAGTHLVSSVRGELLARLGRVDEARSEFTTAASLARNEPARAVLLAKAAALG